MSDLKSKVIEQLSENLGDLEKQAIQGLVEDSQKLKYLKEELAKNNDERKRLIDERDEAQIAMHSLEVKCSDYKAVIENYDSETRRLEDENNRHKLIHANAMLDAYKGFNERILGIMGAQFRFYTQTTNRTVMVDGGEITTGAMNPDGTYQTMPAGKVPQQVTDTVHMNDQPQPEHN